MESMQSSIGMLSMFTHPVFQVENGIIIGANQPAQAIDIKENTSVFDILRSGQEEYRCFTGGSLSLTVGSGPMNYIAAVVRAAGSDFFHLISGSKDADLQALALAAQHLRDPLSSIMALTDNLFSTEQANADEKTKLRIAQLNQNLHRILRSVGNMSDAHSCADRVTGMEMLHISAVITEAVASVQQQLNGTDKELILTADGSSPVGLADRDLLERAVFNLLSNALRYGDTGSPVCAAVRCEKNRVCFTVENSCKDFSNELLGTIFFRYRRAPSITDGGKGLGLGIPIIQAVASAHKGSLLVTVPEANRIRFCLTIPIIQDNRGNLRSRIIRPDYTGGHDRSLIELSDVLPISAYEK